MPRMSVQAQPPPGGTLSKACTLHDRARRHSWSPLCPTHWSAVCWAFKHAGHCCIESSCMSMLELSHLEMGLAGPGCVGQAPVRLSPGGSHQTRKLPQHPGPHTFGGGGGQAPRLVHRLLGGLDACTASTGVALDNNPQNSARRLSRFCAGRTTRATSCGSWDAPMPAQGSRLGAAYAWRPSRVTLSPTCQSGDGDLLW